MKFALGFGLGSVLGYRLALYRVGKMLRENDFI